MLLLAIPSPNNICNNNNGNNVWTCKVDYLSLFAIARATLIRASSFSIMMQRVCIRLTLQLTMIFHDFHFT